MKCQMFLATISASFLMVVNAVADDNKSLVDQQESKCTTAYCKPIQEKPIVPEVCIVCDS